MTNPSIKRKSALIILGIAISAVILISGIVVKNVFFSTLQYNKSSLENALQYSIDQGGDALIVYNTQTESKVLENFHNGFAKEDSHRLFSGTKTFSGVLLAYLIDQGLIESYDSPVSETITEWKNTDKENITYRELLTLSSGIDAGRNGTWDNPASQSIQAEYSDAYFSYGPNPFQIFAEVVSRITGVSPEVYLEENILDPIGAPISQWQYAQDELPNFASGAFMTSESWLNFALFMHNSIENNINPIMSPDVFNELLEPSEVYADYGITLWLSPDNDANPDRTTIADFRSLVDGDLTYDKRFYKAAGAQGQRILFLPEENLIILRFADKQSLYTDTQLINIIVG